MKVNWTKEQEKAIISQNKNILVSAAAGSGKTAVLVERIIRMISNDNSDISIDRLLVVTFTNAAAAEMKERIGRALSKKMISNVSEKIEEQYFMLHKANIMTMHSFCHDLVRNNFHQLGISPDFRIGEQTEINLLKNDVLEKLIEKKYEINDENFVRLVDGYSSARDDSFIMEMILSIYDFIQSCPWPDKWLDEKSRALLINKGSGFEDTVWGQILIKNLLTDVAGIIEDLKKAYRIAEDSGLYSMIDSLSIDLNVFCSFKDKLKTSTWDDIVSYISSIKFERLKRATKEEKEIPERELVKEIREETKKTLNKHKENNFNKISQEIIKDLAYLYPFIDTLSSLVKDFSENYSLKKKSKNILDFNDLEHYCLKLLVEESEAGNIKATEMALIYREKFDEIFVDEYQDSNMVQEVILNAICGEEIKRPYKFMVGDVKQSIYKFRQAEPNIFMGKYNTFSNNSNANNYKILLNSNFRSKKNIINGVNYIFSQIMAEETGEIDYGDDEKLIHGLKEEIIDSKILVPEVNVIDLSSFENNSVEFEGAKREARLAAIKIKESISENKYDYKDMVILLRSINPVIQDYLDILAEEGIPVFADVGEGFFKTVEVQIMISILMILDNPLQDIPLLSVIRSPIFSFTLDDLSNIRECDKNGYMYNAISVCAESEKDISSKCRGFLNIYNNWRKKVFEYPVDELIYYLYNETGYYNFVGSLSDGKQRQANLNMLFEKAKQFEKTDLNGLFSFIQYFEKLKSRRYDMGSATILGENDNVVRIMSVHKSKGLEFPVVIIAGLGKKFNFRDTSSKILCHKELGYGPDIVNVERKITYTTVIKQALKIQMKNETIAEEMRILYVALTRAKDKLILIGSVKSTEESIMKWSSVLFEEGTKISKSKIINTNNFLDWICYTLMRHKNFKELREETNINQMGYLVEDSSKWKANFYKYEDLITDIEDAKDMSRNIIEEFKKIVLDAEKNDLYYEIDKKLNWEYEYKKACELPVKMTVTEIKRMNEVNDEESKKAEYIPIVFKRPEFVTKKSEFTAGEKGTIIHKFMQHLDICKSIAREDVENTKKELVGLNILDEKEIKVVENEKIVNFLTSFLAGRIRNAGNNKVYKEMPFTVSLESSNIYKELPDNIKNEEIIIQGIIDCYFEEEDGLVLIDYKTDFIKEKSQIEEIRKRYIMQIDYYAKALEKITGIQVKERYIYLFSIDSVLKL